MFALPPFPALSRMRRLLSFWRIALAGLVLALNAGAAQAQMQSWSFSGGMQNAGAMAYDVTMTRDWPQGAMRMTGFMTRLGGPVRAVHCRQRQGMPYRLCRLRVGGQTLGPFPLQANIDLRRWMAAKLRLGWLGRLYAEGGPRGHMDTSGQWSWNGWRVKGRFRYWR